MTSPINTGNIPGSNIHGITPSTSTARSEERAGEAVEAPPSKANNKRKKSNTLNQKINKQLAPYKKEIEDLESKLRKASSSLAKVDFSHPKTGLIGTKTGIDLVCALHNELPNKYEKAIEEVEKILDQEKELLSGKKEKELTDQCNYWDVVKQLSADVVLACHGFRILVESYKAEEKNEDVKKIKKEIEKCESKISKLTFANKVERLILKDQRKKFFSQFVEAVENCHASFLGDRSFFGGYQTACRYFHGLGRNVSVPCPSSLPKELDASNPQALLKSAFELERTYREGKLDKLEERLFVAKKFIPKHTKELQALRLAYQNAGEEDNDAKANYLSKLIALNNIIARHTDIFLQDLGSPGQDYLRGTIDFIERVGTQKDEQEVPKLQNRLIGMTKYSALVSSVHIELASHRMLNEYADSAHDRTKQSAHAFLRASEYINTVFSHYPEYSTSFPHGMNDREKVDMYSRLTLLLNAYGDAKQNVQELKRHAKECKERESPSTEGERLSDDEPGMNKEPDDNLDNDLGIITFSLTAMEERLEVVELEAKIASGKLLKSGFIPKEAGKQHKPGKDLQELEEALSQIRWAEVSSFLQDDQHIEEEELEAPDTEKKSPTPENADDSSVESGRLSPKIAAQPAHAKALANAEEFMAGTYQKNMATHETKAESYETWASDILNVLQKNITIRTREKIDIKDPKYNPSNIESYLTLAAQAREKQLTLLETAIKRWDEVESTDPDVIAKVEDEIGKLQKEKKKIESQVTRLKGEAKSKTAAAYALRMSNKGMEFVFKNGFVDWESERPECYVVITDKMELVNPFAETEEERFKPVTRNGEPVKDRYQVFGLKIKPYSDSNRIYICWVHVKIKETVSDSDAAIYNPDNLSIYSNVDYKRDDEHKKGQRWRAREKYRIRKENAQGASSSEFQDAYRCFTDTKCLAEYLPPYLGVKDGTTLTLKVVDPAPPQRLGKKKALPTISGISEA